MWETLVHACRTPVREDLRNDGAKAGSVWKCEREGCGRRWRLTNAPPGTVEWEQVRD